MTKLYKYISTLLAALICISMLTSLTVSANASAGIDDDLPDEYVIIEEVVNETDYTEYTLDENEKCAMRWVIKGIQRFHEKINLGEYKLTEDQVYKIVNCIWDDHSITSFNFRSYRQMFDEKTGLINYITITYYSDITLDNYYSIRSQIRNDIKTITDSVNPDWSDIQKALYIHDVLRNICEYESSTINKYNKTAYSLFIKHKGNCIAYSGAYATIMNKLDIDCIIVSSNDHTWNMINIDDNWYHADVTYDDDDGKFSYRYYKWFMISDEKASNIESKYEEEDRHHTTWCLYSRNLAQPHATDTSYDDVDWNEVYESLDVDWDAVNEMLGID